MLLFSFFDKVPEIQGVYLRRTEESTSTGQTAEAPASSSSQQQPVNTTAAAAIAGAVVAAEAAAAAAAAAAASTHSSRRPVFDLNRFWQEHFTEIGELQTDFKTHVLPLARIKKVMKSDPEVKMISAEAPILFAKGCEIFIRELTRRAWVHAEENKRRTLLRSDIAIAIAKTDMCDFLIDIVPREEAQEKTSSSSQSQGYAHYYNSSYAQPGSTSSQFASGQPVDPTVYYSQLAHMTPEQMQQYHYQLHQFAAAAAAASQAAAAQQAVSSSANNNQGSSTAAAASDGNSSRSASK